MNCRSLGVKPYDFFKLIALLPKFSVGEQSPYSQDPAIENRGGGGWPVLS